MSFEWAFALPSGVAFEKLSARAAIFALLAGCTGYVSEPESVFGGGSTIQPDIVSRSCRPVAAPMRALTARQYDAVVSQLLGDTTHPARVLQVAQSESRFDNHAEWVNADETLVRFYVKSAEALAETAVANQRTLFPCSSPTSAQETECIGQIVDSFGRRAYRRSLLTEERESLLAVFRTVRDLTGSSWNEGLSAVLQVLLQSPQFVYVTEVGVPVAGATRPTSRLTSLEVATKLSLLIWGAAPDDTLLDAAETGQLETKAQISAQATRMLADAKATQGFMHFASQWLELDGVDGSAKNATRFPQWTPALAASARNELEQFVSKTFTGGGRYRDLMVSREATVDAALAAVYGIEATATSVPETRAGVLTRAGWLAGHAHSEDTSPTLRGKAIRTRLLCEDIPPPPPGIDVTLPVISGPTTLRQRLAAHVTSASCASCHRLMDPIGFGFEGFDAIGTARTTEINGLAIDSSGELIGSMGSKTFTGAVELSNMLGDSAEANRCYLTQTYRYAQGRTESSKDRCHLDAVVQALPMNATMNDVVLGVVGSDAFLNRETLP